MFILFQELNDEIDGDDSDEEGDGMSEDDETAAADGEEEEMDEKSWGATGHCFRLSYKVLD